MTEETGNPGEENFAELFASYGGGMSEKLKVGDKIKGRIISITPDTVFIDTGTKIDGAIEAKELLNDAGEMPFAEGDEIEVYVTSMAGGVVGLSRAMSGEGGLEMLREASENGVPVEGRVRETCKGGFVIEILRKRAFCPVSQIDAAYVAKPEEYVGNTFQFLITKFAEGGRNIVVSRRALIERERAAAAEEFLGGLEEGVILDGRVVRVMPFGAFVELTPGVEGMVHVSQISFSRVASATDAVNPGDRIKVKVLSIEKVGDKLRIALSAKQAMSDPWEGVAAKYKSGDKVAGRVTRCAQFGAFVELEPGIEGLIHISEMSYVKRVMRPEDVVQPGDPVNVLIKDIDTVKRRISLSLRDAEGDPWAGVAERFKSGQTVEGTVEKREKFGWFITLDAGITGLLPRSVAGDKLESLKPGDKIELVVSSVDQAARRISLAPVGAEEKADEDWKKFAPKPAPAATVSSGGGEPTGILAAKLKEALAAKNNK